jgi:hypothetical protein
MPPVEFEPTISAGERPYTYALNRAASGTGSNNQLLHVMKTQCDPRELSFDFLNVVYINRVFRRCCIPRLIDFEAIGAVEK